QAAALNLSKLRRQRGGAPTPAKHSPPHAQQILAGHTHGEHRPYTYKPMIVSQTVSSDKDVAARTVAKCARKPKIATPAQWRPKESGMHRQESEIVPTPAICRHGLYPPTPNAPGGATISSIAEMYYPPRVHSYSCWALCAVSNAITGTRSATTVINRMLQAC